MRVSVLGLNFKTASVDIRERLSVPAHKMPELFKRLEEKKIFDERLVLSTCNRTEIYGVDANGKSSVEETKAFLCEYSSLSKAEIDHALYVLDGPQSVDHLFRVASGLDSMIIGETEITGQVKNAYKLAQEHHQTGKVLNHLFQKSLKVAKDLRTKTEIGAGRVSVASVAVDLAEKIFEDLKNSRVMVVGTGEMSTQVAKALISKEAKAVIVSSRHFERAKELAKELGGEALDFREFEAHAPAADIIVTATEAPCSLIREEHGRAWMKMRRERPLFLIDIAVPRNIDPAINELDGVFLYNIDDLQNISNKNLAIRESHLEKCMEMVSVQTAHCMSWIKKEFGGASHGA